MKAKLRTQCTSCLWSVDETKEGLCRYCERVAAKFSPPDVTCPSCEGAKTVLAHVHHRDPKSHRFGYLQCFTCKGTGWISAERMEGIERGRALREDRIKRGLSLRAEAKGLGISAVELSDLEQGRTTTEDHEQPE